MSFSPVLISLCLLPVLDGSVFFGSAKKQGLLSDEKFASLVELKRLIELKVCHWTQVNETHVRCFAPRSCSFDPSGRRQGVLLMATGMQIPHRPGKARLSGMRFGAIYCQEEESGFSGMKMEKLSLLCAWVVAKSKRLRRLMLR